MWGTRGFGLCWPCRFHVVCVNFVYVWWPTRTRFLVEYGFYHSHSPSLMCAIGTDINSIANVPYQKKIVTFFSALSFPSFSYQSSMNANPVAYMKGLIHSDMTTVR